MGPVRLFRAHLSVNSCNSGVKHTAWGALVLDETGSVTDVRVLSTDATGTKTEIGLQLAGTIRGVAETKLWEQAPEAHRHLENRETQGKLALLHSASF